MNENSRLKAKTSIKQIFYKLMNSVNFNIDCQNNIGNCRFDPIYDKISKISFIKKNPTNMLGNEKHKDFARIETMREEIEQTFSEKFLAFDPNDLTFEARKYWVNIERAENLDALQKNQKHIFFNIDQIMENSLKSKATKALIDFDYLDSVLIQSVTIKK